MAEKIAELYAQVSLDQKRLNRDVDSLRGRLTGKFSSIGDMAGKSLMAGIGIAMAGRIGFSLLDLASDAQEFGSKFDVVFADQAENMRAWADSTAKSVGRSREEVRKMTAELGDLFQPLGFTAAKSRELSKEVAKLAIDLGSFNNMADDEALQRLRGTLVGSHENALAFGVVINEAALKAELLAMGAQKVNGAFRETDKVTARLNLLMKGTTAAQGDAARTAESYANQSKALKGDLADLGTSLGKLLIPGASAAVGIFREWTDEALRLSNALGGVPDSPAFRAIAGVQNRADAAQEQRASGSTKAKGSEQLRNDLDAIKTAQQAVMDEINAARSRIENRANEPWNVGLNMIDLDAIKANEAALKTLRMEASIVLAQLARVKRETPEDGVPVQESAAMIGRSLFGAAADLVPEGITKQLDELPGKFKTVKDTVDQARAGVGEFFKGIEADKQAGTRLFEATRTPMEQFKKELAEIERLRSVNAIDEDTKQRAIAAAAAKVPEIDQPKWVRELRGLFDGKAKAADKPLELRVQRIGLADMSASIQQSLVGAQKNKEARQANDLLKAANGTLNGILGAARQFVGALRDRKSRTS